MEGLWIEGKEEVDTVDRKGRGQMVEGQRGSRQSEMNREERGQRGRRQRRVVREMKRVRAGYGVGGDTERQGSKKQDKMLSRRRNQRRGGRGVKGVGQMET